MSVGAALGLISGATGPSPAALLLNFNGADGATSTVDARGHAVNLSGGAVLDDTYLPPSGSGTSLSLPSSSARCEIPTHDDFAIAQTSADWTMEGFLLVESHPSGTRYMAWYGNPASASGLSHLTLESTGKLTVYVRGSTIGPGVLSAIGIAVWNHVCWGQRGGKIYLGLNGSIIEGTTQGAAIAGPWAIDLGSHPGVPNQNHRCWWDDFRFHPQHALYAGSTYTVPTPPLT